MGLAGKSRIKNSLNLARQARAWNAGNSPRPLGQALLIDLGRWPRVQKYYWDERSIRGDVGTLSTN
jgi:hypothetical protein